MIRTWVLWVGLLSAAAFAGACDSEEQIIEPDPPPEPPKYAIQQGIAGYVAFWSGDFQPPNPTGTVTRVAREIHIYEATPLALVEGTDDLTFIRAIRTPFVAKAWSGDDGFYEAALPVGSYSVFVKEDSLFYANGLGANGVLNPAEVDSGEVSIRPLNIWYAAGF